MSESRPRSFFPSVTVNIITNGPVSIFIFTLYLSCINLNKPWRRISSSSRAIRNAKKKVNSALTDVELIIKHWWAQSQLHWQTDRLTDRQTDLPPGLVLRWFGTAALMLALYWEMENKRDKKHDWKMTDLYLFMLFFLFFQIILIKGRPILY